MRKTETIVDHISKVNLQLHDRLTRRFMLSDRDNDVDMMMKISSNIAYMQQTQAALHKNLYIEKHIKTINNKLDRIPPEILQSYMNPTLLEPIENK